ncbi:MAG TPA: DUF4129 domain-containing protein [Pyrinomonadaceae bacterium]|jgi:hypothetical protein
MVLANFRISIAPFRGIFSAVRLLCAFGVVLFFSGSLQATTLAQYRGRIQSAINALDALSYGNAEGAISASEAQVAATFNVVRALLPKTETVAMNSGSLQVNNSWLHDALSDYEKEKANPRRQEMIRRMMERLQSLADRLGEVEDAASTNVGSNTGSKDKNKAHLAEILQRSEYQKKQAEGGALAKLWQRFLKWLSNLFPKSEPLEPGRASTVSRGAQIFVVTLALAVIVYVVWKLAPRFLRRRKSKKRTKREARIVLGERLEPDQTAGDLLAQAEALARAGDLRAAIRKAYIALLCELGDRKIIRLAQHKTNRDYLRAMRGITPLHDEMRKLTHSFEHHWYGFVPATESEWSAFRNGYQRAVSSGMTSNR